MEDSGKWFVYILKCSDGRFYTGMTNDVKRRFNEHRTGNGGNFTKSFGAEVLLFKEEHPTRSEALKRESQIKEWTRAKKIALIENDITSLKHL